MSSPASPRRSKRLSLKGDTINLSTKRRTKSFGGPTEHRASPKPNLKPKKSLLKKSGFRQDNQTVVGIMPVTDKPKKGVRFSFAPSPRRYYSSSPTMATSSPLSSRIVSPRRSPAGNNMNSGSESDTDIDMEDATDVYDNSPLRFSKRKDQQGPEALGDDDDDDNDDDLEVTMDITEIVRPSMEREDVEDDEEQTDDETAMDLTQSVGKIMSGRQESPRYKNTATAYQQDGDTMDFTVSLGKIHQVEENTIDIDQDESDNGEECDMEFTIPLGKLQSSKSDKTEDAVGDDTIDSVEQTMELTMAIGNIKHDDQYREESLVGSDTEEVDMDVTQAHGRLLKDEIRVSVSPHRSPRGNASPRNKSLPGSPLSPRQKSSNPSRAPLTSIERLPNGKVSTPRRDNDITKFSSPRSKHGSTKRTPRLSEVVDIQHGSPRPKVKPAVLRSSPRSKDETANNEDPKITIASSSRVTNDSSQLKSTSNSAAQSHTPLRRASSKFHTLSPSTTPRWGSSMASGNNLHSQTVVLPSRRRLSISPERKRQCLSSPAGSPKRPLVRKESRNSKTDPPQPLLNEPWSIRRKMTESDGVLSQHQNTSVAGDISKQDPIPLSEFLKQCSVQFLDSLMDSATMRPITIPEDEACKQSSREESMKAQHLSSAWLELYRFSCTHLKNNIDSGKELVAALETETAEETPQFFYEFVHGSPEFKSAIEQQFRILKNHSRLMAKSVWYDWRSNVVEGIKPGISKNLNKARQDIEILSKSLTEVEKASRQIENEYQIVQERLRQLRAEQAEQHTDEAEKIRTMRKQIVDLHKAIEIDGKKLSETTAEQSSFLPKIEAAKAELIKIKERISTMEKIRESSKGYAIDEINGLLLKAKEYERLSGWSLDSVNGSKSSFVYREEVQVALDHDRAQIDVKGTCLSAVSLIRQDCGLDLAVRQFGVESILQALKYTKTAVEVLDGTAEKWGQVKKLNNILRRLGYHVPTKISLEETHLKVQMQLFVESAKAKCQAVLKINSAILQPTSNTGVLLESVEWYYGENNYTSRLENIIREKIPDTKVERLADLCDAVTSGQYC